MILTGDQIEKAVSNGEIIIDPFNKNQLQPNSYDFRLGEKCLIYKSITLDTAKDNETVEVPIPPEGLLLEPDKIYLINTLEVLGSANYVPVIRGRSSIGRLGIFIDITADLIDLGSINKLTLQLHAVMPVKVYTGMLIGQITFWIAKGEKKLYDGKYKHHESPVKSFSFKEFKKNKMNALDTDNRFVIHDALHGAIDLRFFREENENEALIGLLNSSFFLRLKSIKQLGFAYHTHISANHTRFSHAIGTMVVIDAIVRQIEKSTILDNSIAEINQIFSSSITKAELRKHLLLAGLLQDMGEIPFAQAIQAFISPDENIINLLKQQFGVDIAFKDIKEVFTLRCIFDSELLTKLRPFNLNIPLLAFLVTGRIYYTSVKQPTICQSLLHILDGTIDADRLDYVHRDHYHAYGTKGDYRSVISSLLYYDAEGPVFNDPGPVTAFLAKRAHLWTNVYLHPENRLRIALLKTFFKELRSSQSLKEELSDVFTLDIGSFKEFDDIKIYNLLREFKRNKTYYDGLSNRGKNALDNLLEGVEKYQWYWITPGNNKQDAKSLEIPIGAYFDLFLTQRDRLLFPPKSIRIKARQLSKIGECIYLEECSGAFTGRSWNVLPQKDSMLIFFPEQTVDDGDWKAFKEAFSANTLYIQIKNIRDEDSSFIS